VAASDDAQVLRLRRDDLHWVAVDDEVVILDGGDELYLGTNGSGALLWKALADGTTRGRLIALLVDTFSVGADQATADVDAFVGTLASRSLLEPTPGPQDTV
jgi:hypothetical protein